MCNQTSPKRIAIFTYAYAPLMTGISAIVHDRIEILLRNGHEVHLVHPDTARWKLKSSGMYSLDQLKQLPGFSSVTYPTVPNPLRPSMPDAASYRVWNDTEKLQQFEPDVILVDEAAGMFGAASVCVAGYKRPVGVDYGQRFGIPVINLAHTDWRSYAAYYVGRTVVDMTWSLIKLRMRSFTSAYDLNFSPSAYLSARYDDFYPRKLEHVSFHGVNCDEFHPDNALLPVSEAMDGPLIVSAGRVTREKNILDLVSAFRKLRQRIPEARLVILGDGPQMARLRRLAAEFDGSLVVVGAVFGETLKWWLARADVYWTASVTENFSMGIMEAMASGTPVVAYAAGGNTEQIEHEVSGLQCQPGDPDGFVEQTVRVFEDAEFRRRLTHGARQRALHFDNRRCVQRLLDRVFGTPTPVEIPVDIAASSAVRA